MDIGNRTRRTGYVVGEMFDFPSVPARPRRLLSLPDLGDRSNGHCPAMRRLGQKILKPIDTRAPMSGNRDMGATDTVDTLMVDNVE